MVGAVHPKAIPVLLTTAEEWRTWLEAPERTAGRVSSYGAIYPTPAEPPISPKFDEPLPFVPNGNLGGPHPASR